MRVFGIPLFRLLVYGIGLCLLITAINYFHITRYLHPDWSVLSRPSRKYSTQHLRQLMTLSSYDISRPLSQIVLNEEEQLNFLYLPLRKLGMTYGEVTSANRDTGYPLGPDFTFHLQYSESSVLLYEDFGPGCIYRIYLFPWLPTDADALHRLLPSDLHNDYVIIVIDNVQFKFSLKQMLQAKQWPFLTPLSTQPGRPLAGIGSYMPFCYSKHITVTYSSSQKLPENLLARTVNCTQNDMLCPVKIYRTKFSAGTKVTSFAHRVAKDRSGSLEQDEKAAKLLSRPEIYGPDVGTHCVLRCVEIRSRRRSTILKQDGGGVITAMKFRVFNGVSDRLMEDWNQVLITMNFDDQATPQVDRVPLGLLLGTSGHLNDFKGVPIGRRKRSCMYQDGRLMLDNMAPTAYIYFPMPFWKRVRVYLEGETDLVQFLRVCFQINLVSNFYSQRDAAYFNAKASYYTHASDTWRNVLDVGHAWGHVVGLFHNVDHLRFRRGGPLQARWAALQADPYIFIDGSASATVMGTGMEDYFSYAHAFASAENTTYAFVGNQYYYAHHGLEPLSAHAYRFHILDPVVFQLRIRWINEGTSPTSFTRRAAALTRQQHRRRLRERNGSLSHLVLYYAHGVDMETSSVDLLKMGVLSSERNHDWFLIHQSNSDLSARIFRTHNTRFIGAVTSNSTQDGVVGRAFMPGDIFRFVLRIKRPNRGVILSRRFHNIAQRDWNQRARIWVNSKNQGVWMVPMGASNPAHALQEEQLQLPPDVTNLKPELSVEIQPMSTWRDLSYSAISLL